MVNVYDAARLYRHAHPGFGAGQGVPAPVVQQAAMARVLEYAKKSTLPDAFLQGGGYVHLVLLQLLRPTVCPQAGRLMQRELLNNPQAQPLVKSLEFVLAALAQRSPETLQHLVHHTALIMMEFERVHGAVAQHPQAALQALVGALGHDVGKLGLDPELLHKHTRLRAQRFDDAVAAFARDVPDYPQKQHDIGFLQQAQAGMTVFCGKPLDAHPPATDETITLGDMAASEVHSTTEAQRSLHTRILARIDAKARQHIRGATQGAWLNMAEIMQLASPERGTLSATEKAIINTHDPMSASFFAQQTLPDTLKDLPQLVNMDAFRGKEAEHAPAIAKLIHLTDVFEALTADRSYRRAYDVGQALGVMQRMAEKGELDKAQLDGFVQGGTWKRYAQAYGLTLGDVARFERQGQWTAREQRLAHTHSPQQHAAR